jgi:egghead protein (zeste-white 4 protein)
LQGIYLVVHSSAIEWKKKIFLGISLYSWVTLPLTTSNIVLAVVAPIPCPSLMNIICAFVGAMNIYMYIFGVIKSFSLHRMGVGRSLLVLVGALLTIPFNIIVENVAVIWGLFGNKYHFYVVNKEIKPPTTV